MNNEELKARARELGFKIRENWMDDIFENTCIAAIFFAAGLAVMWVVK